MINVLIVDDDFMVAKVHAGFIQRTPGFATFPRVRQCQRRGSGARLPEAGAARRAVIEQRDLHAIGWARPLRS